MTSPPATLASTSSAARVTPREATDSSATREVMSMFRLSMTIMADSRYSTSRTPDSRYFCTLPSSLEADSRRRASFISRRTAIRQTASTMRAVRISPTDTFPTEADSNFPISKSPTAFPLLSMRPRHPAETEPPGPAAPSGSGPRGRR